MALHREQPILLDRFEATPPKHVIRWTAVFLALWLILGFSDWFGRISIFQWHRQWLSRRILPTQAEVQAGQPQQAVIPDRRGAGLSRMIPGTSLARLYEEFHPGYVEYRDAWGYFNPPHPPNTYFPVVIAGDSFCLSLGTQNIAQVLASLGNIPVYNHALHGSGPFLELQRFLFSTRFIPPPKVVIWDLIGRELGAPLFERQPVEAWLQRINVWENKIQQAARNPIQWHWLTPRALQKEWPATSLLAYYSRRTWAWLQLALFRQWPMDVLGGEDPQFGPMLFYRDNLRILPLLTPENNVPGIVKMVARLAEGLRAEGMELVVLLVPEKEQIHLRALPPADQQAVSASLPLFGVLESALSEKGIRVVNLLPVFQKATAAGQRLYWRDDTHWNDAGIRLAAEEVWRVVEPLLK